jgi:plasmid maintenance system antidote protein VapI
MECATGDSRRDAKARFPKPARATSMGIKNGMRPVHPGEILREDFLRPAGMSVNALADAQSWLNLQAIYDLRVAEIANRKKIEREISPFERDLNALNPA